MDVAMRTAGCLAWETRFPNRPAGCGKPEGRVAAPSFPEKVKPPGRFNPPPDRFPYEAPRVWESGSERGSTYPNVPIRTRRDGELPTYKLPLSGRALLGGASCQISAR